MGKPKTLTVAEAGRKGGKAKGKPKGFAKIGKAEFARICALAVEAKRIKRARSMMP